VQYNFQKVMMNCGKGEGKSTNDLEELRQVFNDLEGFPDDGISDQVVADLLKETDQQPSTGDPQPITSHPQPTTSHSQPTTSSLKKGKYFDFQLQIEDNSSWYFLFPSKALSFAEVSVLSKKRETSARSHAQ
jgi:hypothetical protein